ncbi:uncharacterized protein LOC132711013 [Pantherophis guttatus]|uniref:Uncharacterized protein LOC132711013 n=1 Tax=Pantherophis guttatus TaxID=94885 RepID=A0ABM3Z920_PANGU|nr:uncharacterized protein LOC132711013 [Pantherophis guttatus]
MGDQEFSSDPEQIPVPPRPKKASKRRPATQASASSANQHLTISDREEQRRHNALEKQFSRAQKQAQLAGEVVLESSSPQLDPLGSETTHLASQDMPSDLPQAPMLPDKPGPSASFTPTAAGLRPQEALGWAPQLDFQALFTDALAKAITSGLQQGGQSQFGCHTCQRPASSMPACGHPPAMHPPPLPPPPLHPLPCLPRQPSLP